MNSYPFILPAMVYLDQSQITASFSPFLPYFRQNAHSHSFIHSSARHVNLIQCFFGNKNKYSRLLTLVFKIYKTVSTGEIVHLWLPTISSFLPFFLPGQFTSIALGSEQCWETGLRFCSLYDSTNKLGFLYSFPLLF